MNPGLLHQQIFENKPLDVQLIGTRRNVGPKPGPASRGQRVVRINAPDHDELGDYLPIIPDMLDLLKRRQIPPLFTSDPEERRTKDKRLQQMRERGFRIPDGWTDNRQSLGEKAIEWWLRMVSPFVWPEAIVTANNYPMRVDFFLMLPVGDPFPLLDLGAPETLSMAQVHDRLDAKIRAERDKPGSTFHPQWRLLALEVDGPKHDLKKQRERDTRKNKRLNELGIEVYRVSSEWACIDPRRVVKRFLEVAWLDRGGLFQFDSETWGPERPADYKCSNCQAKLCGWSGEQQHRTSYLKQWVCETCHNWGLQ